MAKTRSARTLDSSSVNDGVAGLSYQNWRMDTHAPILINTNATIHSKLAWCWGELSVVNDALAVLNTSSNAELRSLGNFLSSRLIPLEAMLNHLGESSAEILHNDGSQP